MRCGSSGSQGPSYSSAKGSRPPCAGPVSDRASTSAAACVPVASSSSAKGWPTSGANRSSFSIGGSSAADVTQAQQQQAAAPQRQQRDSCRCPVARPRPLGGAPRRLKR